MAIKKEAVPAWVTRNSDYQDGRLLSIESKKGLLGAEIIESKDKVTFMPSYEEGNELQFDLRLNCRAEEFTLSSLPPTGTLTPWMLLRVEVKGRYPSKVTHKLSYALVSIEAPFNGPLSPQPKGW